MQRRPNNPIEQRKRDVRRHSRNAVAYVGGGVIGGVALWALAGSVTWLVIGLIFAVVGGLYNWIQIQKIVNHRDNY